jgi:very-short-patch-repair endonuclease
MHAERALAAVARDQAGAFTRKQALAAGFTRRQVEHRVAEHVWRRLLPSVYALASAPPSLPATLWAAQLWAGESSTVSHRSAGQLWVFDDARARRPELWVPTNCGKRHRDVVIRRGQVDRLERRFVAGLRATSPERTLLDLAGLLDEEALEIAFESARRERLVTIASVQRCIDRSGTHGRRGTAALRSLLRELGAVPSESALEVKVARLLRRSKLPRPVQQMPVGRYRLDFAWPDRMVALECDGKRRHTEDSDFRHDRTKWSDLAAAGWRVLIATNADVNDALLAKLSLAVASLPVRPRGRRSTS